MDTPRMRAVPDLPGAPFQLNGVEIPVDQWNIDHGGYPGSNAPVRVQLTFFAKFEPEPETDERRAERLKAELEAAADEAVSQWQAARRQWPDLVPVFDLHRPVYSYGPINCAHCEQSDGMESTEQVPWPCATYAALTVEPEPTDNCTAECGPAEMGEAVSYEVPEGGLHPVYAVVFTPEEIKPIREAARAAGKDTNAYLHDLAVDASTPVTVTVHVGGPKVHDAINRQLLAEYRAYPGPLRH